MHYIQRVIRFSASFFTVVPVGNIFNWSNNVGLSHVKWLAVIITLYLIIQCIQAYREVTKDIKHEETVFQYFPVSREDGKLGTHSDMSVLWL
jgi:hypothetical protein